MRDWNYSVSSQLSIVLRSAHLHIIYVDVIDVITTFHESIWILFSERFFEPSTPGFMPFISFLKLPFHIIYFYMWFFFVEQISHKKYLLPDINLKYVVCSFIIYMLLQLTWTFISHIEETS